MKEGDIEDKKKGRGGWPQDQDTSLTPPPPPLLFPPPPETIRQNKGWIMNEYVPQYL